MFRIVTKIPLTATRFNNRKNGSSRLYRAMRHYSKEKDLCPPPTPKPGTSTGTLFTVGALALVTGGTIVYAKQDEDFRNWLVGVAPFTDDVLKFIYQEELSYWDSIAKLFKKIGQSSDDQKSASRGPSAAIPMEDKDYKAPAPVFPKLADAQKSCGDYTEIRLETKLPGTDDLKVAIAGSVKPDLEHLKSAVDRLADLEKQITASTEDAVKAFHESVYALKNFNADVAIVVEESVDRIDPAVWASLKRKSTEKDTAIKDAQKFSSDANSAINKLKAMLSRSDLNVPDVMKERAKINMQKVQDDLSHAKKELEHEIKKSAMADRYWNKVKKARTHFGVELESLFPSINLEEKKLNVSGGDIDLFVLHAMSKVLYYQKELSKLETYGDQKLNDAIENAKKNGDCTLLSQEQICSAVEKEKKTLEVEFNKKCLKLRNDSEKELREQLKLQSEAFTDHMGDALKTREIELEQIFTRKFDEDLTAERCKYKMEVSAMVGRLRGMEQALKIRADADKTARQAQVLWSACQSLFRSLRASECPGVSWFEQLRPLEPEITAVKKAAAESDELVGVVIAGIPKEAVNRGVFPEDALRERFIKVEQVARSMALVPAEGARLHVYLLSYLQSMLLMKATNPIPLSELNDEQVDFAGLGTNEVLQRARYWLDRGDFAQTLKYMNLLKGASRAVAKQWMNETKILLETQQAANTLMAYAAASGLMYL